MLNYDVVVVGGATTGAYAAYALAKKGLRVALIEAKPMKEAGPTWANAIPAWMFDFCRLPQPKYPMLLGEKEPVFYIRNTKDKGPKAFDLPLLSLDMRLLTRHLQSLAEEAGVTFFESSVVDSLERDRIGRPKSVTIKSTQNNRQTKIYAKLFVDASGTKGVLRSLVPESRQKCPVPEGEHVCSVGQVVFHLKDEVGAKNYLRERNISEDAIFCQLGLQGSYSTLTLEISFEHQTVGILCGNIEGKDRLDAWKWVDEVAKSLPWIGEKIFGGRGTIPLERPYDEVVFPGLVLLGNAGRMVFPPHGSGIGSGMMAGKILADSLNKSDDIGDEKKLQVFQQKFMREVGAIHASYDLFRQFSQQLSAEDLETLVDSDFMMPSAVRCMMMQKMLHPNRHEVLGVVKASKEHPHLAKKILPILLRMRLIYELYRKYPRGRGPKFKAWQAANRGLWSVPF